ncbi:MAG: M28 family metallopeptidase [Peptococcaceae bacterium]
MISRRSFLILTVTSLGSLISLPGLIKNASPASVPQKTAVGGRLQENHKRINPEDIRSHVELLAGEYYQGRRAGTSGDAETCLYLAQKLHEYGIGPAGNKNTYFQTFSIPRTRLVPREKRMVFSVVERSSRLYSDNVLGLITSAKNPAEYIILSAHHDHLGIWEDELYPGANDNASGTAAVLELARALNAQREKLPCSIIIAFWGAEEMGLIGSEYFIQNPTIPLENVLFNINLDSIGTGSEQGNFIYWTNGERKFVLPDQLVVDSPDLLFSRQDQFKHTSDHRSFAGENIRALSFLAENWLNHNHTPLDVPGTLNYQSIFGISSFILRWLLDFKEDSV